jgi:hypothetical protein
MIKVPLELKTVASPGSLTVQCAVDGRNKIAKM